MSEFVTHQEPEQNSIAKKAVRYAIATAVVVGGIGLAVHFAPALIKTIEGGLVAAA